MNFRTEILMFLALMLFATNLFSQNTNYRAKSAENVEFIIYEVEVGEGLFAISKKFGVSQAAINKANPNISDGIKAGQTILIPKISNSEKNNSKQYVEYVVEKRQTLFAISRAFNVSQQEILDANPEIKKIGLKHKQIIRIPIKSKDSSRQNSIAQSVTSKNNRVVAPKEKESFKIAFLLPFMSNQERIDPTSLKFIEFYLGSLLAINNYKNIGVKLDVLAFDIEKTETKVHSVINRPEIRSVDLIIGPAYTLQIPIIADFAKRRKIYSLVPFSSNVNYIESNPYVFQFNPERQYQYQAMGNAIKNSFKRSNILVVKTNDPNRTVDELKYYNYLLSVLKDNRISYRTIDISELGSNLSFNQNDLIIYDTENFDTVKGSLEMLNEYSDRYSVAVLGQYSWRNSKGKKPKMYYVSPFKGNVTGTQYYEANFQKFYNKKPIEVNPRYDLLGYDLTSFILSQITNKGFRFDVNTPSIRYNNGVQSNFLFERDGNYGGFMNKQLYLIEDDVTN